MAPLTPLNDFVLIDPEVPKPYHEYRKFQHIVVPDVYEHGPEDRPVWGKVVEIGPSCRGMVRVDERVLIGKWDGAKVEHNGHKYVLVKEDSILAVDG